MWIECLHIWFLVLNCFYIVLIQQLVFNQVHCIKLNTIWLSPIMQFLVCKSIYYCKLSSKVQGLWLNTIKYLLNSLVSSPKDIKQVNIFWVILHWKLIKVAFVISAMFHVGYQGLFKLSKLTVLSSDTHKIIITMPNTVQSVSTINPVSVPPLFVIEFLHRVVDTFEDYFSECTESIIKENYVVVYEVRSDFVY